MSANSESSSGAGGTGASGSGNVEATGPLSPSASITTLGGCGSASSLSCTTTTTATPTTDGNNVIPSQQQQQPVSVSVICPTATNVIKQHVPISYSDAARKSIGATTTIVSVSRQSVSQQFGETSNNNDAHPQHQFQHLHNDNTHTIDHNHQHHAEATTTTGYSETSGCGTASNSSSLCTSSCCCAGYGCDRQLSITPPTYHVGRSLMGPSVPALNYNSNNFGHNHTSQNPQSCCTGQQQQQCCSCNKPALIQTPVMGSGSGLHAMQHHGAGQLAAMRLERDVLVSSQRAKMDAPKQSGAIKATAPAFFPKSAATLKAQPHISNNSSNNNKGPAPGTNQPKAGKNNKKGKISDKSPQHQQVQQQDHYTTNATASNDHFVDNRLVDPPPFIFPGGHLTLNTIYQFEIPQIHVGKLIGKQGSYVNHIRHETGASVVVNKHPFCEDSVKIVQIEGRPDEIKAALELIRERFPLHQYPEICFSTLSLSPVPPLLTHPAHYHNPPPSAVAVSAAATAHHLHNNHGNHIHHQFNGNTMNGLIHPIQQQHQAAPIIPIAVPELSQLFLPEAVSCDVIVCAIESAGHVFLQQPSHPTFHGLALLMDNMAEAYHDAERVPKLPAVKVAGMICACPLSDQSSRDSNSDVNQSSSATAPTNNNKQPPVANQRLRWYRCQIIQVPQPNNNHQITARPNGIRQASELATDECLVKLVDSGGYRKVKMESLRQIRQDFMSLPFQSVEVFLAGVVPSNESDGWCKASKSLISRLTKDQVLQAEVRGYTDNGIPFVLLVAKTSANKATSLNKELAEHGYAKWINEATTSANSCESKPVSFSQQKQASVMNNNNNNDGGTESIMSVKAGHQSTKAKHNHHQQQQQSGASSAGGKIQSAAAK